MIGRGVLIALPLFDHFVGQQVLNLISLSCLKTILIAWVVKRRAFDKFN